jgi:hypothetical protein
MDLGGEPADKLFFNIVKHTSLLFIFSFSCFAQVPASFEPSFCLSLSGKYGNATYHYQLNQAGDSGVIIVQGRERPMVGTIFSGVKKSIVNYAINLTEVSYGSQKDSADFNGDLAITALDRTTIVRVNAGLVIGTLTDTSMTGLLRLLMKQVEDSLRLPQVKGNLPSKKSALSIKKIRF